MKRYILLYFLWIFFRLTVGAGDVIYKWEPADSSFDSLTLVLERINFTDRDRSVTEKVISKMYRLAKEKNDPLLLSRTLYWDSWKKIVEGDDSVTFLLDRALALTDTLSYPYDYARLLQIKGNVLRLHGNWLEAYRIYKKVEACFKEREDWFYIAKNYVYIGTALNDLKEYERALEYFRKGGEYFLKAGSMNCEIKNRLNISNVLYITDKQEEALNIIRPLLENPIAVQDTSYLVNVLISLSSISRYTEKGYAERAYALAETLPNKSLVAIALASLGASCLKENKNDSALYYYREAYRRMQAYGDIYNIFPVINGLAEANSRLNKADSAYYYLRLYENYRDSLLAHSKIGEVNRIESRAAVREYEFQLQQAEEKNRWHRRTAAWIIGTIFCLSAFACYVFWTLRNKEKIKKQLQEIENKKLFMQLENEALQIEKYRIEIDSKNRELTSNTLLLTEKNRTMKNLLERIGSLGDTGVLPQKEAKELKKQINEHLVTDDEWKYFKLHFEQVHPDFFIKLKERFPGLSENDLRLCAYIRIGMSSKQMAQMLSILPDTIFTARYRLRKKMELEKESLDDFLRSL